MDNPTLSSETKLTRADHPKEDPYGAHVMPIYQTSTFKFDSVEAGRKFFAQEEGGSSHSYTRLGNPTVDRLEEAFAGLEGRGEDHAGEISAMAFSSGMAAITTTLIAAARGGSIIAQPTLYGCTGQFLQEEAPDLGIKTHFMNLNDLDALDAALKQYPEVKVIYGETMANPTMELLNLPAIAEVAKANGVLFIVDNTFATPMHLRPLEYGADAVLHSTTKYLNGHGTLIGGALVAKQQFIEDHSIHTFRKNLGGVMSPFEAWLNLNGLKTFNLRMQRHAENAMKVAEYLDGHDAVEKVYYPGLKGHADHELAEQLLEKGYGGILSFELKGGYEAGVSLMDHVELCTLAVSLGTVDTLIQHPASMTHAVIDEQTRREAGITEGLVRLAVGIESPKDIINDLEQALAAEQLVVA